MGNPKGFLKVKRQLMRDRPAAERIKDFRAVSIPCSDKQSQEQASRCMDCGTSFCQWGCPLGNYIPEWNDLVFNGHWESAFELLNAVNPLAEITGRLCPAHCEYACVLGINDEPVTIRENELAIIEYAFKHGLVKPVFSKKKTGKNIAIVGSGPAGLSCAEQLNKAGHNIVVLERDDKIGGILRYGIPDFKLEKRIIDRRLKIWQKEGIEFAVNVNAGENFSSAKLLKEFDAVCLAIGCRVPRDFPPQADQPLAEKIEGRKLKGIYFAMDYLIQANKKVAGRVIAGEEVIDAKGKNVVVIGGGDTGADCMGLAHRQGAASVTQIELLPKPSELRTEDYPWPNYPIILKTSSSHQEGGKRFWSVLTKKFIGEAGKVKKLLCLKVEFLKEIPGSAFQIDADLVILAIGFVHPEYGSLLKDLKLNLDTKGNIKTGDNYMTSKKGVFCAGDMRTGQSLIAQAIFEGKTAAYFIDTYLMDKSCLPFTE